MTHASLVEYVRSASCSVRVEGDVVTADDDKPIAHGVATFSIIDD